MRCEGSREFSISTKAEAGRQGLGKITLVLTVIDFFYFYSDFMSMCNPMGYVAALGFETNV